MTLINTVGLVLIGPGSEWFWIALQFAALAITFIAIYRQLRGQQLEIQDNLKLLRSQAHYNALLVAQRPWELLIEDDGFASLMNVAYVTPDELSDGDWARCNSFMFMQFNAWEYFYYQHQDGSIPTELWAGAEATFQDLIATKPGYARFWAESRLSFAEPFRAHAAQEFAKQTRPPLPAP